MKYIYKTFIDKYIAKKNRKCLAYKSEKSSQGKVNMQNYNK